MSAMKKKEQCRSTEQGIETLSDMLLKFYQLKKLDYRLSALCEKEKDLNETLKLRKASTTQPASLLIILVIIIDSIN